MAFDAPSITRYGVTVRMPRGIAGLGAFLRVDRRADFFVLVAPCVFRAMGIPAGETGLPLKGASRVRGGVLDGEPQAHQDLVDVFLADPDMPTTDSLFHEAEGFVQPTG